jgi:hypothetical protein
MYYKGRKMWIVERECKQRELGVNGLRGREPSHLILYAGAFIRVLKRDR